MKQRRQDGGASRTAVAVVLSLVVGLALGIAGTLYWLRARISPARVETTLPPPPPIVPSAAAVATTPSAPPSAEASPPSAVAAETPTPLEDVREARAPGSRRQSRPVTPRQAPPAPNPPVAPVVPANPSTARRFVQGATSVENLRPIGGDLRGFDNADVDVKRAPAVNGRLELEMVPDRLLPGQPYVVRVFLANDDKRPIELVGMKAATLVDGKWVQVPLTPETNVVGPRLRALLHELPGIWKSTVRSWSVEVEVTSKRQDVYRNRLTWR